MASDLTALPSTEDFLPAFVGCLFKILHINIDQCTYSTYNILNVVNKSSDVVVWWARANSIYYRISSKHIWTWLNCPIHMNYFCDVFVNFLKHQNYGGMDFPWRDRNLLVFIKMSSFVFWWWTKVLWVWMTWGWVNDRIYFSEWQTLWVNSQVVMWTNG